MAKVCFAPYVAVKYVGSKSKEFSTSLARPKPILKKGDIVIVDKRSASNLVHKGFGNYKFVEEISFNKDDSQREDELEKLNAFKNENNSLFNRLTVSLSENKQKTLENEMLKKELAEALELLVVDKEESK